MDGVDEMAMDTRAMDADADVMMGDQPMKVHSGLWYAVAEDYLALMTPDGEIAGLWVANEDGTPMAFFYCEHSWYRVESKSGALPDPKMKLLAVVGSRKYTNYGKEAAAYLISERSTFVSGTTMHIDGGMCL